MRGFVEPFITGLMILGWLVCLTLAVFFSGYFYTWNSP